MDNSHKAGTIPVPMKPGAEEGIINGRYFQYEGKFMIGFHHIGEFSKWIVAHRKGARIEYAQRREEG